MKISQNYVKLLTHIYYNIHDLKKQESEEKKLKILGIIAEYNPFHNGHLYQIQKAKEQTQSDFVIIVMSGNFTQQGNIAIMDKFKRASLATQNGADLVIELPFIYANSSSSFFAQGAILLLNQLNIIDSICFGSEASDISILESISQKIIHNETKITQDIKENLKLGISFAKAREMSLGKFLNKEELLEITKPNNILAIEYLIQLKKQNSKIAPITIQRKDSSFHDLNLPKDSYFTSATSIRKSIFENNILNIRPYVPDNCYYALTHQTLLSNNILFLPLKYSTITKDKNNLQEIMEMTEGLENKLLKAISCSKNNTELLNELKSKRYQLSKLKRLCMNILLNVTKKDFKDIICSNEIYAHVLAKSEKGNLLLSRLSQEADIPLITKVSKDTIPSLSPIQQKMFSYDLLASNLYSILANDTLNKDYTNKL